MTGAREMRIAVGKRDMDEAECRKCHKRDVVVGASRARLHEKVSDTVEFTPSTREIP